VTIDDVEKYFRLNSALEAVALAIVVISFVGDICCIFRGIGPAEVSGSFQGHCK